MRVPVLESERLIIREFELGDIEDIYRISDIELGDIDTGSSGALAKQERKRWLQWTVMNYEQLEKLYQPPFGDRALALRTSGELIGACGYVPSFGPHRQAPALNGGQVQRDLRNTLEFGLYFAVSTAHQGFGYATEAANALIQYAFSELNVLRVVAWTHFDNSASIGVMRKLGMQVERNAYPDPPWLQVVGVLENQFGLNDT